MPVTLAAISGSGYVQAYPCLLQSSIVLHSECWILGFDGQLQHFASSENPCLGAESVHYWFLETQYSPRYPSTAILEEPFNNKIGSRTDRSEGSFWELLKLGRKSTVSCFKSANNIASTGASSLALTIRMISRGIVFHHPIYTHFHFPSMSLWCH